MLKQTDVEQEEERLRQEISSLGEEQRREFYRQAKSELKDPDTYAAFNWFFIAGLHHFYLGRWQWGLIDLAVFCAGITLLFSGFVLLGIFLVSMISIWELWALFRSQVIVQDWNNKVYRRVLKKYHRL